MKRFVLSYLLSIVFSVAHAAECDSIPGRCGTLSDFAVDASLNVSRILPTNAFLKNYKGNDVVLAPDLRLSFKFAPTSKYGVLYPNVRQGVGINLSNILPNSSLGRPVSFYLFQSVRIAGDRHFSISGEWNFGVSAGWSKYEPNAPIANTAIGSNVNALLGLGLCAVYRVSDNWALKASVNALHFSNGNTHLPNAGVNTVGVAVGVQYYLDPATLVTPVINPEKSQRGFSYDLTAYGASRRRVGVDGMDEYVVLNGSFGVAGINFAPMYDLNPYFRAGVSLDLQYDESANLAKYRVEGTYGDRLKFYRQSFADCFAAGLSVRAELTLPIFSVNVGLGRNVIANGPDTRIFYQTLALKAYVWKGSFLQVGYQLCNFHLPNNLMLGCGYTFGRK